MTHIKDQNSINIKPSIELGKNLYQKTGCIACHAVGPSREGKTGPSWHGIYDQEKTLHNKKKTIVNEEYLKESILFPNKKIVHGYQAGMPSYRGILQDHEVKSIILYIKSMKK